MQAPVDFPLPYWRERGKHVQMRNTAKTSVRIQPVNPSTIERSLDMSDVIISAAETATSLAESGKYGLILAEREDGVQLL